MNKVMMMMMMMMMMMVMNAVLLVCLTKEGCEALLPSEKYQRF